MDDEDDLSPEEGLSIMFRLAKKDTVELHVPTPPSPQSNNISSKVMYTMKTVPNKHVEVIEMPQKGLSFKLWRAALLLCEYLEHNWQSLSIKDASVLEIGAGTGVVGLVAAHLGARKVMLTDMEKVVELMNLNISANHFSPSSVTAAGLDWIHVSNAFEEAGGLQSRPSSEANLAAAKKALPPFCQPGTVDLILASDVIYLESLFEPLLKTLVALTTTSNQNEKTPLILISYERRRKVEKRFFRMAQKYFDMSVVCKRSDDNARHGHIQVIQFKRKRATPSMEL